MAPDQSANDSPDTTRSKVGRLIAEHDLQGMGDELEDRWTGATGDRQSLRELATYFNRELLATHLRSANRRPLDGEVANLHRLLTDDGVPTGERTRAQRELERDGVDVDRLTEEFVSHQAVHTFLTKYRDVEKPATDDGDDPLTRGRETVERLQGRLQSVARGTVVNLRRTNRLSLGDFSVYVDVRVVCEDCNTSVPISELLSDGSCECDVG